MVAIILALFRYVVGLLGTEAGRRTVRYYLEDPRWVWFVVTRKALTYQIARKISDRQCPL